MNPFELKPKKLDTLITPLSKIPQKPYDKLAVSPYTRVRLILAQGTEFEANWNSHQLDRRIHNNDIRRRLAFVRRNEQIQHKMLASLKPSDENPLETTLAYEQLAVDLTAILAKRAKNYVVKQQLDFALLEDFDHLYRFSDLLEMDEGKNFEHYLGDYTEVMPGRPTVAEFRHPNDDVRFAINSCKNDLITNLDVGIITAAEQQTMNFYMNLGSYYPDDLGRKMFSEIALIEEQHVTGYESLKDTELSLLECNLMHEYTECYLYYSLYEDESDENIKGLYERIFEEEVAHLHEAADLLKTYEGKCFSEVIPDGNFPELIKFGENISYVRNVLKDCNLTAVKEGYVPVRDLEQNADYYKYQKQFVASGEKNPTHKVIEKYIKENGEDLRFETAPHPVSELRNRKCDNLTVGRGNAGFEQKNCGK